MKKILLVILISLIGVSLFAYPAVSNYIFSLNCSTSTRSYDDTVAKAEPATLEKALAEAKIYNENLEGSPVHDPFVKGSGMAMADNYFKVLNLGGDGAMGYINIPKIGVRIPIHHGTSEKTLLKGVGHLENSSLPIGGAGTHSVLTGHTGLANAKMFTDLVKLGQGDEFFLHVLDQVLAYKIDQIKVVLPEVTDDLRRVPGEDYSTLVTCTPYGVNTHRLLLRGVRTEYVPENAQNSPAAAVLERLTDWDMLIGLAAGIAVLIIILIILLIYKKKKKDEKEEALPSDRSDKPWEMTPVPEPLRPPGGRKIFRSHKKRKKSPKYWWDESGESRG